MNKQQIFDLIVKLSIELSKYNPATEKLQIKSLKNKIKMLRRL